jgi:very-short-patch-repair endonuclease
VEHGVAVTSLCDLHDMTQASLDRFGRRQHGLVTRAQALTVMSRRQVEAQTASGHLVVLRRSVYRIAGSPETWHQHLLAACLAGGPGTYASFRAAAALWGLVGFEPDALEVTVPRTRRARLEGVIVHDSIVTGRLHTTTVQNIPTASAARTLTDLSAVAPRWMVEHAVDDALRRKLVTIRTLSRVAGDLDGRGRRRSRVTRAVLDARRTDAHPGQSEPELRIAKLLVRAGLPAPVHQHRVRVGRRTRRLDLAYPELMIAIEYDGWSHHSQRSAFDADRARANELELLGWTVLRFTSASSDAMIVATVSAALQRARVA